MIKVLEYTLLLTTLNTYSLEIAISNGFQTIIDYIFNKSFYRKLKNHET